jgi:hypothetical protein
MGVKKFYEPAEVKAAIDMANQSYYRQMLRVRNDVSDSSWKEPKIKVERLPSGAAKNPTEWQGKGSDVGHNFRHMQGTATPGKSTYADEQEMILATRELLNSAKGQEKLGELDSLNPKGDELGMNENRKIQGEIVNVVCYGFPSTGEAKQRIKSAACEIMKVGESTLWIHTTYPKAFHTS